MNKGKDLARELGQLLLAAVVLFAAVAVCAGIVSLIGQRPFVSVLWRLGIIVGALVLLLGAVLLLLGPNKVTMPAWKKRFPHIGFAYGLVTVGIVMLLLSGCVELMSRM